MSYHSELTNSEFEIRMVNLQLNVNLNRFIGTQLTHYIFRYLMEKNWQDKTQVEFQLTVKNIFYSCLCRYIQSENSEDVLLISVK